MSRSGQPFLRLASPIAAAALALALVLIAGTGLEARAGAPGRGRARSERATAGSALGRGARLRRAARARRVTRRSLRPGREGRARARAARRPGAVREAAQAHPQSTYRLQLTPSFTFAAARETLPYLRRLGIRTVYLSPVLQARSGSQHGYDTVDPSRVSADLGGAGQFRALVREAHRQGLNLVLDVVPNHMGVSAENRLWDDVLAHGRASRYARTFDIDWGRGGKKKLVLPVLGDRIDQILARHELTLGLEKAGGFRIHYFDKSFPIDPKSAARLLSAEPAVTRHQALARAVRELGAVGPRGPPGAGERGDRATRAGAAERRIRQLYDRDPAARSAIDAAVQRTNDPAADPAAWKHLLGAQAYRLSYWRTGNSKVNYRRFFSVNDLAAVRQEDPAVFDATQRTLLDLVRIGHTEGVDIHLRIDHPDGLADPADTLSRFRQRLGQVNPKSRIWVESILARGQTLPDAWPVAGTTGYDFLNQLGRAAIDPAGFDRIETWYRRRILGRPGSSFEAAVTRGKRQMLRSDLAPDVRFVVDRLERLAGSAAAAGDQPAIPRGELTRAVVEVITQMPVYRTYLTEGAGPSAGDAALLDKALSSAHVTTRDGRRAVALLRRVLLDPAGATRAGGPTAEHDRDALVTRFQQLSAAAMAKGLEDTAHYRDYPLAALNEVGGSPAEMTADPVGEFHRAAAARDPEAMLAATTHDTKRTADARARLAVLSWEPDAWIHQVESWQTRNRPLRGRVDANTEYLVYQTLVALWPAGGEHMSPAQRTQLESRVTEYMIKAAREGKRKTRWSSPDQAFEADLTRFVHQLLSGEARAGAQPFTAELSGFVDRVDRPAAWSSLSRTVVHYSAPGTADTYQGDELWNRAAVDPDNRRPVNYKRRAQLLSQVERFDHLAPAEQRQFASRLLDHPADDRLKLHVVRRALAARNAHPALFGEGDYTPLRAQGGGPPLLAFARTRGHQVALTLAPEGPGRGPAAMPVGRATWGNAVIEVPAALRGARLVNAMTGEHITLGRTLRVADALGTFPAAVLVGEVRR